MAYHSITLNRQQLHQSCIAVGRSDSLKTLILCITEIFQVICPFYFIAYLILLFPFYHVCLSICDLERLAEGS